MGPVLQSLDKVWVGDPDDHIRGWLGFGGEFLVFRVLNCEIRSRVSGIRDLATKGGVSAVDSHTKKKINKSKNVLD